MIDPGKPLRVLVSEGSSTSAREAITILGLAGHHVEVCDPSAHCLARFSRFVRKWHRCPGLRIDPAGFLAFIEKLLARGQFYYTLGLLLVIFVAGCVRVETWVAAGRAGVPRRAAWRGPVVVGIVVLGATISVLLSTFAGQR